MKGKWRVICWHHGLQGGSKQAVSSLHSKGDQKRNIPAKNSGGTCNTFRNGSRSSLETRLVRVLIHGRIKNKDAIWWIFLLGLITSMSWEKRSLLLLTDVAAVKIHRETLSAGMPLTGGGDLTRKCLFCLRFSSSLLLLPCPLAESSLWWLYSFQNQSHAPGTPRMAWV